MTPNEKAFLDTIAVSELGAELLHVSDDGYNVIVGSTPAKPHLFTDYHDHPNVLVQVRPGLYSTAAGRYQLLSRNFDSYRNLLGLPDFSPASQDAIALQQIRERRALPWIEAGDFDRAIGACSALWASLPGNSYGQPQTPIAQLRAAFVAAGGVLAPELAQAAGAP